MDLFVSLSVLKSLFHFQLTDGNVANLGLIAKESIAPSGAERSEYGSGASNHCSDVLDSSLTLESGVPDLSLGLGTIVFHRCQIRVTTLNKGDPNIELPSHRAHGREQKCCMNYSVDQSLHAKNSSLALLV